MNVKNLFNEIFNCKNILVFLLLTGLLHTSTFPNSYAHSNRITGIKIAGDCIEIAGGITIFLGMGFGMLMGSGAPNRTWKKSAKELGMLSIPVLLGMKGMCDLEEHMLVLENKSPMFSTNEKLFKKGANILELIVGIKLLQWINKECKNKEKEEVPLNFYGEHGSFRHIIFLLGKYVGISNLGKAFSLTLINKGLTGLIH